MIRALAVASLAVVTASCAPALMRLPSGPGDIATDTRDVVAEATAVCRGVGGFSAEIGVSGSVGGQRLSGRLLAGLAPPASTRLEAVAPFGQPAFIFVAHDDDATLLLPRDARVLEHGRPRDVLDAVAGVPLDGSELRMALTGCAAAPDVASGRALGPDWRIVTDGPTEIYLNRATHAGPWRLVSTVRKPNWRAEFREFEGGLPRAVRLVSAAAGRFDLRLRLSQVDAAATLGPEVFRVEIPRSAQPITLDELRNARPGVREN